MTYQTPGGRYVAFGNRVALISLPALPFDLPPPLADETKPALLPVRGDLGQEDKRWLRRMARVWG